jgi:hypothetical protein
MALAAMAAVAVWLLHADSALAALFLIFDRTSGSPGAVVRVQTGGNGGCTHCPSPMQAYWLAASVSSEVTDPRDSRLIAAGQLEVDAAGNAKGTITVPNVPNGPYVVMVYCPPCAPHSAGRSLLPVGPDPPFVVSGPAIVASSIAAPVVQNSKQAGAGGNPPLVFWLVIGLASLALAASGVLVQLLKVRRG